MERALRRGAVTEERDGHRVVAAQPGGVRRAHGDRDPGRDDAVGAEDADRRIGDVHRTASTTVGPSVLGHQLGEHADGIEPLGQAVPVPAVGGGDHVVGPERPARADRRRLLADREVNEARYLAVAVQR